MLLIFSTLVVCMQGTKVHFFLLSLSQMPSYELKMLYWRCSRNVDEWVCARVWMSHMCICARPEWTILWTRLQLGRHKAAGGAWGAHPRKRETFFASIQQGKEMERILNTQVLRLAGAGGEPPEGEQTGWSCCPRKARRGMWSMTALPAGWELFMGSYRSLVERTRGWR